MGTAPRRLVSISDVLVRISASALLLAAAGFAQPAFEVATVKLSTAPDYRETRPGCRGGPGSNDPGRFICEHFPLGWLVRGNWELQDFQFSGPKWMEESYIEINAKVPAGATRDDLRRMMQKLLTERFRMEIKTGKREIAGYELVVGKDGPKLKESAPLEPGEPEVPTPLAGRPRVTMAADGYPDVPPDTRAAGAMMMTMGIRARWRAPRESMDGFARGLSGLVRKPVVNATGLNGMYDIMVAYVRDDVPVPPPPDSTRPLSPAEDPAGPNIFIAIQQQLGLRLEPKKVSVEFLSVDRAERTPMEN